MPLSRFKCTHVFGQFICRASYVYTPHYTDCKMQARHICIRRARTFFKQYRTDNKLRIFSTIISQLMSYGMFEIRLFGFLSVYLNCFRSNLNSWHLNSFSIQFTALLPLTMYNSICIIDFSQCFFSQINNIKHDWHRFR